MDPEKKLNDFVYDKSNVNFYSGKSPSEERDLEEKNKVIFILLLFLSKNPYFALLVNQYDYATLATIL